MSWCSTMLLCDSLTASLDCFASLYFLLLCVYLHLRLAIFLIVPGPAVAIKDLQAGEQTVVPVANLETWAAENMMAK